ncbi:hypothetical protein WUBG_03805 [Wuchereria bancrofti]|uniref:Uncharacterized protein n=1 Tax=Wuchereria bancrofti TaxID=6293 RepID=J9ERX0_WUCBA|nr:hypothetical protein WUBG_03805 [Wuchereria bancrofti]
MTLTLMLKDLRVHSRFSTLLSKGRDDRAKHSRTSVKMKRNITFEDFLTSLLLRMQFEPHLLETESTSPTIMTPPPNSAPDNRLTSATSSVLNASTITGHNENGVPGIFPHQGG